MINNNYLRLIDKLIDATKENRINWQQTTRDNEYQIEINGYSIAVLYISKTPFSIDLDKTATCTISLINEEGVTVDTCSISSNEEGFEAAVTLYKEAKRSYYKVDDVLKELAESI